MISVIIPLYNKGPEIRRTLESVLAQEYQDFEIIVVDDGSTDGGARVVEDLAAQDGRISLICKENGGVCSARNVGIKAAKGEFIALLDADDAWDVRFLSDIVGMIEDFPQCGMWGINYAELYEGELVRHLPTGLPEGFRGVVENYFNMPGRVSDLFCSSSVVKRREVFDAVGYFDERLKYSEDIDQWWRIIAGYPIAFYDRYAVSYFYDAGQRAMNRKRLLRYWLPFYPEKYAGYKGLEPFYTFVQRWCGVRIRDVYFTDGEQRKDALEAARKLDYSVLPPKYRLFFRLPFFMGKMLYRLTV